MAVKEVIAQGGVTAGQRLRVSVLFVDMVGYTPLAEELGEDDTFMLMQEVHRELQEAVQTGGGSVQDILGDGLLALFGGVKPTEDAPFRACRVAFDIHERIARLQKRAGSSSGPAIRFRAGIHTGPVVIGDLPGQGTISKKAVGDTVNLAARIQQLADPGTVFISDETYQFVSGRCECEPVGEFSIKGKSKKCKLWRLEHLHEMSRFDAAIKSGLTPFVGRERELAQLRSLWSMAGEGRRQVAMIEGEPGIGKSRLVHEFQRTARDAETLFGHCTPTGSTVPFFPLVEALRQLFGAGAEASEPEVRSKLIKGLTELEVAVGPVLPLLLNLLGHRPSDTSFEGMDPHNLGRHTRDMIVSVLHARSTRKPTLLIVEDVHWSDSATEQVLEKMISGDAPAKLLVLATIRSGKRSLLLKGEISKTITIPPLLPEQTEQIIETLLGSESSKAREVLTRSEGNPYFVEELAHYFRTSSSDHGRAPAQGQSNLTAIPMTLESLLLDRYARLNPEQQELLNFASAIGTRFTVNLIVSVIGSGDDVRRKLRELEGQDQVVLEPKGAARFRHALARDAVYNSLLNVNRRNIHAELARAIESNRDQYSDDAERLLAHHWRQSNEPERAAIYLKRSGEMSLRVYSLDEAEQAFREALALVEIYPGCLEQRDVADVVLSLARILYFQYDCNGTNELIRRFMPTFESLNDPRRLSRALFESGYAHVFASRVDDAKRDLQRARHVGEETGDDLAIAYAELGQVWIRAMWGERGDLDDQVQRDACERTKAIGVAHGDVWLASKALLALGAHYAYWGQPHKSLDRIDELMSLSIEMDDPRPRSLALIGMSAVCVFDDNPVSAIDFADQALKVTLSPVDVLQARVYRSMAGIAKGDLSESVDALESLLRGADEKGLTYPAAPWKLFAGLGRLLLGDLSRGMGSIKKTLLWTMEVRQRGQEMLCRLVIGETYLAMITSKERASFKPTIANLLWLARTVPFARHYAHRELKIAAQGFRELRAPSHLARAVYRLGVLDRHYNRRGRAVSQFMEALALARSVGANVLARSIEADLAAT